MQIKQCITQTQEKEMDKTQELEQEIERLKNIIAKKKKMKNN